MPYIDNDEVQDGETVHVPMMLKDAQAARRTARVHWIKSLNDAWKKPQRDMNPGSGFTCPECHGTGNDPDGDSPTGKCDECNGTGYVEQPNNSSSAQRNDPGPSPDPRLRVGKDAATVRRAAYDAYCQRLTSAWRTLVRDAAEPDAAEQLLGRHLSAEPVANARAVREDSYEDYKRRLGSAWQQGRTDPGRATAIEEQGEKWRHGK
jgi:hypothetical protein